jgi:hypothetical protein
MNELDGCFSRTKKHKRDVYFSPYSSFSTYYRVASRPSFHRYVLLKNIFLLTLDQKLWTKTPENYQFEG